jgi:hypothetical protein
MLTPKDLDKTHYRVTSLTPYQTNVIFLPVTVGTSPRAGGAGAYIGGGRKTPLRVGWGMGATAIENKKKTSAQRCVQYNHLKVEEILTICTNYLQKRKVHHK